MWGTGAMAVDNDAEVIMGQSAPRTRVTYQRRPRVQLNLDTILFRGCCAVRLAVTRNRAQ